jgi:hypothetical protein
LYGNKIANDYFVRKGIISLVKGVEFVGDRMPYIIPRGHWCDIILSNPHAPTEDKYDDTQDSFYEELQPVYKNVVGFQCAAEEIKKMWDLRLTRR